MTRTGKVVTAKGTKPVGAKETSRENLYIYGTVEPDSGGYFIREYERMSSENFQDFLNAFGQAYSVGLHLMVLDGAGIHWAHDLVIPENLVLIKLPPYCPELNPIERLWEDLKKWLVWKNWPSLTHMKEYVWSLVRQWNDDSIHCLTAFDWILQTTLEL